MKAQSRSSSIRVKRSRHRQARLQKGNWTCRAILRELRSLGEVRNVKGMARFGIRAKNVYGVAKPKLDLLARELWDSGVHDARILAGMIDDALAVTAAQMERCVRDFDNWDVCDGTCCHLFVFCGPAWKKAVAWSKRKQEFVKRAGFALMAYLAYRDKAAPDAKFLRALPIIEREANDERNFVHKAVNWALRNIGKRNVRLNRAAIRAARRIREQDSRAARWIAADALRELQSDAVQRRLRKTV
jgi:3-methyladenine DNA glycosylase AlkD